MNASLSHSPSSAIVLAVIGLGIAVPFTASAAAPSDAEYKRIVPRAPNPDLSAAAIAALCTTIASKSIPSCPAAEQAKLFCATPLNMVLQRPSTSDLDAIAKDHCPSAVRAMAALGASTKAAGLFDLGWQDALIRGLAGFLVERAKAEALAAAADRFRTGLCDDPAAKRLLPLTCALLESSDPYSVPVSWGAVRITAEKDLHDLPLHVLDLKIPRRTDSLKDAPELLYAAIDITERAIAEHEEPLPLLVGLRDHYASAASQCSSQPMGCALLGTGIASEVILTGYKSGVASTANFAPIAVRVILDQAIAAGLVKAGDVVKLAQAWQTDLATLVAVIDRAGTKGTAAKASRKPEDVAAYAGSLGDIVASMLDLFGPSIGLTGDLLGPPEKALKAWPVLIQASLSKDYVTASVQLLVLLQAMEGAEIPDWMRYLPLLAELAQAENPDQVKRIIESLAAPVGSYRGKRGAGNRRLTINGYVGAQGGWEWLGGSGVPAASSFQGGVFAPIGIESSWGFGKSSSLGVFLSVIDLGAVVSFRTASESDPQGSGTDMVTVKQEPQIGLSQVFSPGLYVVWGIPCTPLVLGAGGALAPDLRKVTFVATGTTETATAFRLGAFLAIDVTIFPF